MVIPRGSSTYKVKGTRPSSACRVRGPVLQFERRLQGSQGYRCNRQPAGFSVGRRGCGAVGQCPADAGDPKLQQLRDHHPAYHGYRPRYRRQAVPGQGRAYAGQIHVNTTKMADFEMTPEEDPKPCCWWSPVKGEYIRNSGYGGWPRSTSRRSSTSARLEASDHTLDKLVRKSWKAIRFVERLIAPRFTDPEGKNVNPDSLDFKAFTQKVFQGDERQGYLPIDDVRD